MLHLDPESLPSSPRKLDETASHVAITTDLAADQKLLEENFCDFYQSISVNPQAAVDDLLTSQKTAKDKIDAIFFLTKLTRDYQQVLQHYYSEKEDQDKANAKLVEFFQLLNQAKDKLLARRRLIDNIPTQASLSTKWKTAVATVEQCYTMLGAARKAQLEQALEPSQDAAIAPAPHAEPEHQARPQEQSKTPQQLAFEAKRQKLKRTSNLMIVAGSLLIAASVMLPALSGGAFAPIGAVLLSLGWKVFAAAMAGSFVTGCSILGTGLHFFEKRLHMDDQKIRAEFYSNPAPGLN